MSRPIAERFWSHVTKTDGCWVWTASKRRKSYGQFNAWCRETRRNRIVQCHRFAWEWAYGSIPIGMWVLHHCDNPPCVRPGHLFLGTSLDNVRDMIAKGRRRGPEHVVRGESHHNSKLTEEDVISIREMWRVGLTQTVIAERFGICPDSVSPVARGRLWRHVQGPLGERRPR